LNNQVTIITTPHSDERLPYLKRFLNYYKQTDFPPKIFIADSSPSTIKSSSILKCIDSDHVTYKKFPHNTKWRSKLYSSLKLITTRYVLICEEDNFIVLNGIKKASEQLDVNDDIVAVYGYLIGFISEQNNNHIIHYLPMQPVLKDSISERIKYYVSEFPSAVISALYRTKHLKHIWKLANSHTDDFEFGELLPAFLTPIYGKIAPISSLFWVREIFPDSLGQSIDTYRLINIVADGSYQHRYKKFKDCMVNEICGNSNLDIKQAEDLVNTSFEHYFYKRFGCNYKQLRRKILLKKALKKAGLFSFAKGLKSKIIQNPVIVSQEQNYEDDPLFPKNEWDEMKIFLENNMIQS